MPRPALSRFWLGCTLAVCTLLGACSLSRQPDPLPGMPRIVLWAWERPERLLYLNPSRVGVAFLASTIRWRNGHVQEQRRRQPLELPLNTKVMAVVRLESDGQQPPAVDQLADRLAYFARLPGLQALQVDFDARESERAYYRQLLRETRRRMPPQMPLTMTALASWCEDDVWLEGLPVAEATPMVFRMGTGIRSTVTSGTAPRRDFRGPLCRTSLGIATDELPAWVPRQRRLFFFHAAPWTAEAYQTALGHAARWQ